MELLGRGQGWAVFCPRRPATAADSNSSVPPVPYGGKYGVGGSGYVDLPSIVVLVVLPMEDLEFYDGMDRFGVAVRELRIGVSNGGVTPGGALGVGGFDFDDVSPQFPAAPDTLRGDSLYGLFGVGRGNGMMQVEDLVVPVRLRETPQALMSSLGCSPSALEVRAMRTVLPARLRLLHRLVVLVRMCRDIPTQLGDEIKLVEYRFTQASFDSTYNPPAHIHIHT